MAHDVCPVWVGYFLLNPLRKLFESPERILRPFVGEGLVVLEPGCGMGYFTLPLARMVGSRGKVIAVDLQPGMLSRLEQRALKAGLAQRITCHQAQPESMGIHYLEEQVDFALAIHVAHEMPSQSIFFDEVWHALKPGGRLLVIEPSFHVSKKEFRQSVELAEEKGFQIDRSMVLRGRKCLLVKHRASGNGPG